MAKSDSPSKTAVRAADRPVWLVGMMGSGKSSVGPLLARTLARPFLDSDAEIERRAGRTIAEIFASEGEPHFRALETAVIDLARESRAVVALGGGAVAQPGAAARLTAAGTVVYLRTQPMTLLERIRHPASRPLLAGLSPGERESKLAGLLEEREPAYLLASIVVDTDGRAIADVAREVAARLTHPTKNGSGRSRSARAK